MHTVTTTLPAPTAGPLQVTLVFLPAPVDRADPGAPKETLAAVLPGWPEGEPTWQDAEWR